MIDEGIIINYSLKNKKQLGYNMLINWGNSYRLINHLIMLNTYNLA